MKLDIFVGRKAQQGVPRKARSSGQFAYARGEGRRAPILNKKLAGDVFSESVGFGEKRRGVLTSEPLGGAARPPAR